jgi:hypothetical protein
VPTWNAAAETTRERERERQKKRHRASFKKEAEAHPILPMIVSKTVMRNARTRASAVPGMTEQTQSEERIYPHNTPQHTQGHDGLSAVPVVIAAKMSIPNMLAMRVVTVIQPARVTFQSAPYRSCSVYTT